MYTEYITREEFGLNLFETIRTIGGIMGIDAQRAEAIHRNDHVKVAELNTRRQKLQVILANQFHQLSTSEADHVIDKYPWSAGCLAGRQT